MVSQKKKRKIKKRKREGVCKRERNREGRCKRGRDREWEGQREGGTERT